MILKWEIYLFQIVILLPVHLKIAFGITETF